MAETEIFDLFEEADGGSDPGGSEDMAALARIVNKLWATETRIKRLEDELKEAKAQHRRLSSEDIPAMMDRLRVNTVTTADGVHVELQQVVSASIPVDNRERAYEWLRKNGHDGIIKNDVVLSFGKGEDDTCAKTVEKLRQITNHPFDVKTHIHPQTLKAFVRECLQRGIPIDLDLFGAYVAQVAQVKVK